MFNYIFMMYVFFIIFIIFLCVDALRVCAQCMDNVFTRYFEVIKIFKKKYLLRIS